MEQTLKIKNVTDILNDMSYVIVFVVFVSSSGLVKVMYCSYIQSSCLHYINVLYYFFIL